jgi:deazaflavin-dependent oxidoreductase (nitroreductase family)
MNTKDFLVQWWSRMHEIGYRATDGRALNQVFGMPVVLLTTTGRKSGVPRTTTLATPIEDGETIVLVASNGGDERHPAWFLNLCEDPDVDVTLRGQSRPMRARVASPAEKAELWPRTAAAYYGYVRYQGWTERDIPLVILEPRAAG